MSTIANMIVNDVAEMSADAVKAREIIETLIAENEDLDGMETRYVKYVKDGVLTEHISVGSFNSDTETKKCVACNIRVCDILSEHAEGTLTVFVRKAVGNLKKMSDTSWIENTDTWVIRLDDAENPVVMQGLEEKGILYDKYLNLAVSIRAVNTIGVQQMSCGVTKDLLNMVGLTFKEALAKARDNMASDVTFRNDSLTDSKGFGSSYILYPEILGKVCNKYGCNDLLLFADNRGFLGFVPIPEGIIEEEIDSDSALSYHKAICRMVSKFPEYITDTVYRYSLQDNEVSIVA